MGHMYDHVTIVRIFTLVMYKVFICASKTWRSDYNLKLDLLTILYLLHVSYQAGIGLIIENNHLCYGHFTHVTKDHEREIV